MKKFQFIDLSQPLFNGIPRASLLPRFVTWPCLSKQAGDSVNSNAQLFSDHTGTHVDAPRHIFDDGKTVDQYPVDAYSGRAIGLDLRECDGKAITAEAIQQAEKKACRPVEAGDIVLLVTNHSKLWEATPNGYAYLKNRPWVDPEAAQYLIDKGIKAIGIDVGGPDPLGDSSHIIHNMLLSRDILIIESLANLESVMNRECMFLAFPLKLQGSTGSPTRAVAMLEE